MPGKSLPGSPINLNSTRRAFALDSRTVWVEQQIVLNGIVSKDNLYVSPMDYDPKLPAERHIPQTIIARPTTVDTFHPYRGNTGGTGGLPKRGTKKKGKKKKKKITYSESLGDIRGSLHGNSHIEFASPFTDHDKRMPYDPRSRFYIADHPPLPFDPILYSRCHSDGVHQVNQVGSFMPREMGERLPVKKAYPLSDSTYDPDRPSTRRRPKLGKILPEPSAKRDPKRDHKVKPIIEEKKVKPATVEVSAGPPIKTRKQPVEKYDASCYKLNKKEGAINMTPMVTKKKAKVNVFQNMLASKINYQSKNIESPLAERVRRNYM